MNTNFEVRSPDWSALRMDAADVAADIFESAIDILESKNLVMGTDYAVPDIIALAKVIGDTYNTSVLKIASQDVVGTLASMMPDNSMEIMGLGQMIRMAGDAIAQSIDSKLTPVARKT